LEPANLDIKKFSSHIFWDVDVNNLDIIRSKKLIVQRVLGYGLINDWKILLNLYGIAEIAETAVSLRDLDNKSVSFISVLSKIPEEQFVCYTSKLSIPKHLIF